MVTSVIMAEPTVKPPSTAVGLEFAASDVMFAAQLAQLFILEREKGASDVRFEYG